MGEFRFPNYELLILICYLPTPISQSVLRQAADFTEGDDVKEEGDDERPRFARHQQQNSETQNQGNHQINQSCQGQFH